MACEEHFLRKLIHDCPLYIVISYSAKFSNPYLHMSEGDNKSLKHLCYLHLCAFLVMQQRPTQKEAMTSTASEFSYEDVCKPGSTLLWDLVQEDKVVSFINLL